MKGPVKWKEFASISFLAFALGFSVPVLAQESSPGQEQSPGTPAEEQATQPDRDQNPPPQQGQAPVTQRRAPASRGSDEAAPGGRGPNERGLSFMDSEQTWREAEYNNYQEWLKRNPRYSHPLLKGHGTSPGQEISTVDQVYGGAVPMGYSHRRPYTYAAPWFYPSGAGVRHRIIWYNDRYPSGRYYGPGGSESGSNEY